MGMRGAGHRFMPNRLVFPGGAVDRQDGVARAAAEPRPEVLARLQRNAGPKLARALVMAAARELQEETGLCLGTPPCLDTMEYLCRAVTPTHSAMRFNARFLVASAAAAQGALSDSHELHALRFYPLSDALELDLVLVTREVLRRLQAWFARPADERSGTGGVDVYKQRMWRVE